MTESASQSDTTVILDLTSSTQGPPWPPSEVVDKDNNFVLIGGFILTKIEDGPVVPMPNQGGVIVSRNTVPPLKDGKPFFSNPFAAPYDLVGDPLDLSPGSKDLEMELYASSFGPWVGEDLGPGHPRVPRKGESDYNLNPVPESIPGLAPTQYIDPGFSVPRRPLNEVPVWALERIPRHVPVGIPVNPRSKSASRRAAATYEFRRSRPPIRLKDFLRARGQVKITLTGFDEKAGGFTRGRFDFSLRRLLPRAVYSVIAARAISFNLPPNPDWRPADPLAIPRTFVTNSAGNARVAFEIPNPFPAPMPPPPPQFPDPESNRIIGLVIALNSDYQGWGAAPGLIAPGIYIHGVLAVNVGWQELFTVEPGS